MLATLAVGVLPACRVATGPSLASWVKAADDICFESQRSAEASRPVLTTPTLVSSLQKSSAMSKEETNQLRDLERPNERRDEVRDYLGALDDRTLAIDTWVSELTGGAFGAVPQASANIDRVAAATQKAAELATVLGLEICRAGIDMLVGGAAGASPTGSTTPPSVPVGVVVPESVPEGLEGSVGGDPAPGVPIDGQDYGTEDGAGD